MCRLRRRFSCAIGGNGEAGYNAAMAPVELRDADAARRFVLQGVWLQRVTRPAAANLRHVCDRAICIATSGDILPPLGFVADLGHLLLGTDRVGLDRPAT